MLFFPGVGQWALRSVFLRGNPPINNGGHFPAYSLSWCPFLHQALFFHKPSFQLCPMAFVPLVDHFLSVPYAYLTFVFAQRGTVLASSSIPRPVANFCSPTVTLCFVLNSVPKCLLSIIHACLLSPPASLTRKTLRCSCQSAVSMIHTNILLRWKQTKTNSASDYRIKPFQNGNLLLSRRWKL